MNKQLFKKSMTSIAVAGTMLFSAAPVFAADTATKDPLNPAFKKVVDVQDNDTYQPAETFKFTVKGASTTGETRNGMTVSSGTGTITASDVTTDASLKGDQTYTGSFDLSKLSFEQPGIYKYEVKEAEGTNSDMDYDGTTRYLYVFAKRDNGKVSVYGSELVNGDTKSDTFTNGYGVGNKAFKDLTIKKNVTGAMGDTNKYWNFTLNIKSGSGRKTYAVTLGNTKNTATTLTSGVPYTFTLKSGESIKVENLSTTDTYTVTEEEADTDGYKTEGQVTNPKAMVNDNVTETITNNRDAATPTGIMMMYGPYALMVALAGVLGFIIVKRHRVEEE